MAARFALDASALLCLLNDEPGADRVAAVLADSMISTVNYSEVVAKIVERGGSSELIAAMLDPLHLQLVDFDLAQATQAGFLRDATRPMGLSLGDRACLALAATKRLTALTSDHAWKQLESDIPIELLR